MKEEIEKLLPKECRLKLKKGKVLEYEIWYSIVRGVSVRIGILLISEGNELILTDSWAGLENETIWMLHEPAVFQDRIALLIQTQKYGLMEKKP